MARRTSLAPTITWGVILILGTLVLGFLWNVALTTDWLHRPQSQVSWWAAEIIATLLFVAVVGGLVSFIVGLARQIRLNQHQQNFIDAVTHELKSPLTSLKLHLETLKRRELSPEQRAAFVATMLGDVERLDALIDHVLAAARTERQAEATPPEPVDLGQAVASAIERIVRRHELERDAIVAEGPGLQVWADPAGLDLILGNLLDNAVKYGGDAVAVRVRWQAAPHGQAELSVSDSGVGIAKGHLKRLFRRFGRLGDEATRQRQGTGLGLHLVAETAKRLGGKVRAASPGANMGSVFTVTLPLAPQKGHHRG